MATIKIYHIENSNKTTIDIPIEIIQRYPDSPFYYFWKNHPDEEINFETLSQNLNCEFTFSSLKKIIDVICDKLCYLDAGSDIQHLLKIFNLLHPIIEHMFTPIHNDIVKKFNWINKFLYQPGQFTDVNYDDYLSYINMLTTNKNIIPVQILWRDTFVYDPTKKESPYQQFISTEIKKQRAKNPGLANREYMQLAAEEWNKYKVKNNILTGGSKSKTTIMTPDEPKVADTNLIACINIFNGLPIYYKSKTGTQYFLANEINDNSFQVNKFRAQMCIHMTDNKKPSKCYYHNLFSRNVGSYLQFCTNLLNIGYVDHAVLQESIGNEKILQKNILQIDNPKPLFSSVFDIITKSQINVKWANSVGVTYGFVHV